MIRLVVDDNTPSRLKPQNDVPAPLKVDTTGGITPSGQIILSDDGTYDVTRYASAKVNIDYQAKTIEIIAHNHTSGLKYIRSIFNGAIVNNGYIFTTDALLLANSGGAFRLPKGSFVLKITGSSNFDLYKDGSVVTPSVEKNGEKYYSFSSSAFPTTGGELDIYDSSAAWKSNVETESLTVTSNGTTTAPSGKAYSSVTANVPNSYTSADEGKVVSNGALVSQTSDTVTQNGTVDTTLINSLLVNVASGGGVTAATGEVVVSSDIASPTATQSKNFPNIQLTFVPDFFLWSIVESSYLSVKGTASSGTLYWAAMCRQTMMPVQRTGNASNTETPANGIRVFASNNNYAYNASTNPSGWGIVAPTIVDSTRLAYWSFNSDGTVSYGRINNSQQTKILAGTYRYIAVKF